MIRDPENILEACAKYTTPERLLIAQLTKCEIALAKYGKGTINIDKKRQAALKVEWKFLLRK